MADCSGAYKQVAMEETKCVTTLVVSGRKFLVNRKALVENSSYFRAMLDGGFREACSDVVDLKALCDPDAFAIFLDYVINKEINLNDVSRLLSPVLALSDMLNDEEFPEFLKRELFNNWSVLESASSVLVLAEMLDVTAPLLSHIFSILKNHFIDRGRCSVADTPGSSTPQVERVSIIDSPPDIFEELFGTEEATVYPFSDFNDVNMYFVKGIISWILKKEPNKLTIRNIVRCLGVEYLCEDSLMEVVAMQPPTEQKYLLGEVLKCHIEDTREFMRSLQFRLCVGWTVNMIEMHYFDFLKWRWDLIHFHKTHNICTAFPETPNVQISNATDQLVVNVRTWYTKFKSALPDNCSSVPCEEPMYCSGLHVGDESYRLLIFELQPGRKRYSTLFRTTVPGRILGCHLCRVEDVLHGFVSYIVDDKSITVSHFSLQRNEEDMSWFNSEFRLKPLLTDLRVRLTPVATAISERGILVLFRRDQEFLWLAVYNVESGNLIPLGHLPMPCKLEQNMAPVPVEGKFEDTAENICTFKFACCCCNTWSPIFHLSSVSSNTQNRVTSPFFYGFDRCAMNGHHHSPQLKLVINVCSSTS